MQRRSFLNLSLPVLSGALPSRAQEEPTFRTETLVVEVPVVVRDRRSKTPVDDLQREDFELRVNGRSVPIDWFSVTRSGRVARDADPLPALPEGFIRNRASDQPESGRVVALVVDTLNARFEDVHFAIKGAISTLESIDPDDRVGLYVINRLGAVAVHDFGDDREDLLRRLRSASSIPQLFDGIAIDPPDNTTTLTVDRSFAETEGLQARIQLLFALRGLQGIAEHLAFIPGRKAMVWLSIGFDRRVMYANLDLWNRAIERISGANVAVYGVDTMGLRTVTGFSAEYGSAHRPRSRHIRNMQPVQEMAGRTGGRTYMNTNNIGRAIREAIDDSEVVYTLAFTAREEKWNGAYRRIKVSVDRKGVELRHREGYLARLPQATTEEESERLLTDTLLGSVHATGLPLRGVLSTRNMQSVAKRSPGSRW